MVSWFKDEGYDSSLIEIGGSNFEVFVKKNKQTTIDAPRIVVVSYQPNNQTSKLLKLCINSILKFTISPYELWVIDNNSPLENIQWLDSYKNINIAFIRTKQKLEGSFANALALEVGVKLIEPESKYLLSFHEDIVVCKFGWLDYLKSKINERVRATGFRLTKARVPEGVLHVCGYMIDFQLFRELNLSYMPMLPQFDVGDKAIFELRQKGYNIFATPNTFDDPDLENQIDPNLKVKEINATRSFDDNKYIIYMHLGRGVPKAAKTYSKKGPCTFKQWEDYIQHYLFSSPMIEKDLGKDLEQKQGLDPFQTIINNFIDLKSSQSIAKKTLNLEGNYNLHTDNNAREKLEKLNEYDLVISPNLLEVVDELDLAMEKIYSALKKGGVFLAGCPYMYNNKYGKWVSDKLWLNGYREVSTYPLGGYYLASFLLKQKKKGNLPSFNLKLLGGMKKALEKDQKNGVVKDDLILGYGFKAVK